MPSKFIITIDEEANEIEITTEKGDMSVIGMWSESLDSTVGDWVVDLKALLI